MLATLLIYAAIAAAPQQSDGQAAGTPPQRVRNVQLYGDEKCPEAAEDEIVVCGRNDAGDLYRIPKQFRQPVEIPVAQQAWTRRVETMDEVNRVGLPNSCSPVGSGGFTGCNRALLNQWSGAARQAADEQKRIPGGAD